MFSTLTITSLLGYPLTSIFCAREANGIGDVCTLASSVYIYYFTSSLYLCGFKYLSYYSSNNSLLAHIYLIHFFSLKKVEYLKFSSFNSSSVLEVAALYCSLS